jgi:hypothetical protein
LVSQRIDLASFRHAERLPGKPPRDIQKQKKERAREVEEATVE